MERWTEKLGWGVDALIEIRGFGGEFAVRSPHSHSMSATAERFAFGAESGVAQDSTDSR